MLKNLIIGLGIQGIKAESTDAEVSAAVGNHINAQASKIAELEKKLQDQRDAEIKSFLDAAQNDSQKITAEQRAHYEKIAKDGQFETVKELINGLQPRAKVTNQVIPGTNGGGADPRADWDWDKWQKEDPKGLEKMDKEDNEKFMNLYNAKYNPA